MTPVWINLNGEIISALGPALQSSNRSFKYGDGLFESIRIINGKAMLFDKHFLRLKKGMEILQLDLTVTHNEEDFRNNITELAQKNSALESGRARLTVFRNEGGLYTPSNNNASFLLEVERSNLKGYELNEPGLTISIYDEIKKPLNKLSCIKSNNCLIYIMAGLWKKKNNLDDCILLNEKGNICEATTSNLFIVKDKVIYTPALSEGCVKGVMRQYIIDKAKENNISVVEDSLNTDNLKEADEVFLTNAVNGIRWVAAFGGKRYFNMVSKQAAEILNNTVIRIQG